MIKGFSITPVLSSFGITLGASGVNMDIESTVSGYSTLLRLTNQSTNSAAVTRFSLGSQGGSWHIDNERNGAILKFTRQSTVYLTMDNVGNIVTGNAAIATNATGGFLYVAGCAGAPTGTPTAYTGRVPIVVDTTNNKLYFYSGGAWRDAGP